MTTITMCAGAEKSEVDERSKPSR